MPKLTNFLFVTIFLCGFNFYGQSLKEEFFEDSTSVSFNELTKITEKSYQRGDYQTALQANTTLIEKAFETDNTNELYKGYRFLGYTYLQLRDTLSARESFKKASDYAKVLGDKRAIARSLLDHAKLVSDINNNYTGASEYYEKAITTFEKNQDSAGLAEAHYRAAQSATKSGEFENAYTHILKARKYNKYEASIYNRIGLDIATANYYENKGNPEMAREYLKYAIREAEKDSLYNQLQAAYINLSNIYLAAGDTAKAYTNYVAYEQNLKKNLEEIADNRTKATNAQFQLTEYKNAIVNIERENELQHQIVENKSRLNVFLIITSACFLLLIVTLIFAYRKRKELNKVLRKRNREYLEAKRESERLADSKTRFFSTVSHELRTPLYGVVGLSNLLLEDRDGRPGSEELKALKYSADYLLALINDVLNLSKIENNGLDKSTKNFNLKDLLSSITGSFDYMLLQNNSRILLKIDPTIPKVMHGNITSLSQVLMNLIGNACKFTQNGVITISISLANENEKDIKLKFDIIDTGAGIPKDKQKAIFDEFEQINSQNQPYQGSGLGLPIVKKILELQGATITLNSEVGKGSTFSFEYPLKKTQGVNTIEITSSQSQENTSNKCILVVEDNKINQMVTEKILNKKNIKTEVASNGEEAVEKVKEKDYDLILMDINMPIKNGMEATKEIRLFNKQVPIVALTAAEVDNLKHDIFKCGMNDVLMKPYNVDKFMQTVMHHITNDIYKKASQF